MVVDLMQQYWQIRNELAALEKEESKLCHDRQRLLNQAQADVDAVGVRYTKELEHITNALSDITVYEDGAKQYSSLGRYTPTAIKIEPNVLQQLYIMISPDSDGQKYALELLKKCSDIRAYYLKARTDLEKWKVAQERLAKQKVQTGKDMTIIDQKIREVRDRRFQVVSGTRIYTIAKEVMNRATAFSISNNQVCKLIFPIPEKSIFCYGFAAMPLILRENEVNHLKKTMAGFYREKEQAILIPIATKANGLINGRYPVATIKVIYNNSTRDKTYSLIQGFIFNVLRSYQPLSSRILFIDLESFNNEFLGCIKPFSSVNGPVVFPNSLKECEFAISQLEKSIISENESDRNRRFLIIRGGASFGSIANDIIRLYNNASKFNLSILLLYDENNTNKDIATRITPTFTCYSRSDEFYSRIGNEVVRFFWFSGPEKLDEGSKLQYMKELEPKKVDSCYESYYPINNTVSYSRTRKPVKIPFGVDEKGNKLYYTMEGINFSSYVMGVAGSGKTTFLQPLLLHLIRNYHPDEVEIWLADFAMGAGFGYYARHRPPHIKYILLDNSPEAIKDFITLLHEEMERRERLLGDYGCSDRLDLDPRIYMPCIIVVIDEFIALAKVIKDDPSDAYRDMLQELFTKGRKPGLRIFIASQSYLNCESALTATAKDQMGARFALTAGKSEIEAVLDLPHTVRDRFRGIIENMPNGRVLHRFKDNDGVHAEYCQMLFLPSKTEYEWESRYHLFDWLNKQLHSVKHYSTEYENLGIEEYIDKKPVVVQPKSFQIFDIKAMIKDVDSWKNEHADEVFIGDFWIRFGHPRILRHILGSRITSEKNENILLLYNDNEIACSMSIIQSVSQSIMLQGGNVQIWTVSRNRVYSKYKSGVLQDYLVYCGTNEVKIAMQKIMHQYESGIEGNTIIIVLGIERILKEIEDDDSFGLSMEEKQSFDITTVKASEGDDNAVSLNELSLLADTFYEEKEREGYTEEQIDSMWEREMAAILQKTITENNYSDSSEERKNESKKYSFSQDTAPTVVIQYPQKKFDYHSIFHTLLALGSRHGYHIMVAINDLSLLKEIGSVASFNHRLSFRTDTAETSGILFNDTRAKGLGPHICRYASFGTSNGGFTFNPYLYRGITWDQWEVDEEGRAIDRGK